ncbi:transposase family protein [Myxococcus sp. AM009]|nr:transposase family protein [Myxococcus sp. AM009]NVJ18289.1 transposase family protein [Myxococcus sp. AM010]
MSRVPGQRRRALRHAQLEWSCEVMDPRQARGRRHGHQGLLGLLVAAFACGLKSLRRVEDLAQDLGARVRRQLGLAARVPPPERTRQTLEVRSQRVLGGPPAARRQSSERRLKRAWRPARLHDGQAHRLW